jgi:uncharacterized protein (TIGR02145 family)
MAENLAYKSTKHASFRVRMSHEAEDKVYYNWNDANSVCPQGWKLPNMDEWNDLIVYYGGRQTAFNRLVSKKNTNNIMILDGFAGPSNDSIKEFGKALGFWTSSKPDKNKNTNMVYLGSFKEGPFEFLSNDKSFYYSVRCIKITMQSK